MARLILVIGLLIIPLIGFSQATRKIKGEILNEAKSPIPGLAVLQLGTQNGVVSDSNGQFELQVNADQETYILLSGLDLEIFMKYTEDDEFKRVALSDWKKIRKDNKNIWNEWKSKLKK